MNRNPILLVEDNPDDEALALRAFRKNNIVNDVVIARDGAEALDLLLGTHDPDVTDTVGSVYPTVVLLDLKLPKIDGLEVLRRLRQHPATSLLPVVILTTSSEERDMVEGYRLGTNSYVRKPVDFSEFMEAVRQLGAYWLLLNEPPPRLMYDRSRTEE
jgi:two-component system, response regulator